MSQVTTFFKLKKNGTDISSSTPVAFTIKRSL